MITQNKIIKAAEATGWNCTIGRREKKYGGGYDVAFQRYTEMGQDVYEEFYVKKLEDLPYEVYERWQNFDVDEEAAIWIGPDGHGRNGAPYRITDIVKDMEEVENDLEWLQDALHKIK